MNIRFRLPWETKTSDDSIVWSLSAMAGLTDLGSEGIANSYVSQAQRGYMANPDVFACIREIAVAVKGIPWRVYTVNNKGERIPVDSKHPYLALMDRPNARMSGSQYRETLVTQHLIAGSAYTLRVGAGVNDAQSRPINLYLLRPDQVTPIAGPRMGEITSWRYSGAKEPYDGPMVRDFPYFNPLSDTVRFSPLQAAASGVNIGNTGRKWNWNLLKNSGNSPQNGMFATDQDLTQAQYDANAARMQSRWGGAENAGKFRLIANGLKWLQTSLSPAEMDWKSALQFSTEDICKVYNVPQQLVSDSANKTYSNYAEARQALYMETVLPLMDWLCEEFNAWLTPLFGDRLVLDYDRDGIEALQEDRDKIWARASGAVGFGMLTPNEARRMAGLGASTDPACDLFYISRNMVPIEMAGAQSSPFGADAGIKSCGCEHETKAVSPVPLTAAQKRFAASVEAAMKAQRAEVLANVKAAMGEV